MNGAPDAIGLKWEAKIILCKKSSNKHLSFSTIEIIISSVKKGCRYNFNKDFITVVELVIDTGREFQTLGP